MKELKFMNKCFTYILFLLFLLSACATEPVKKAEEEKPSVETKKALTPAEQETESLKTFNKILTISQSSNDRQAMLPQMEEIYAQLIKDYPDAPLAQESYWRLIIIYVDDYSPPAYEKAETLYNNFLENYPRSALKGNIDRTLGLKYYINKEWGRLLKLCAPVFKKYTEEGKSPMPFLIFMYAEANFHLGNLKESEKGFKIVIEQFPQLNENERAKARLEAIRRK
jgi:TolA-binding protein